MSNPELEKMEIGFDPLVEDFMFKAGYTRAEAIEAAHNTKEEDRKLI